MVRPKPVGDSSLLDFTTLVATIQPGEPEGAGPELAQEGLLAPGDQLGDYVIASVLGVGGGGIVYAAEHRVLGRRAAIKALRPEIAASPGMIERFVREAALVNRIGHPNIVDIYHIGEIRPGRPYYVMELLTGRDLRQLLMLHGRFTAEEMLELLEPVCSAVQAAHDAGVVHRDIKATNVFIAEVHGQRTVKLLDFGIAKVLGDDGTGQGLTKPGATLGSPHHMAPEQIRCEPLDARADVYALGVLIYQLLTGEYPFNADEYRQIALLHLHSPPPRPSALARVSPAMDALVARCLEKEPRQRFASVAELIDALRRAVAGAPAPAQESLVPALGVYVELTVGDKELDDAMYDDINRVLDMTESLLAAGSFSFPLRTSGALLALRTITAGPDAEIERAAAEANVAELITALKGRENGHPELELAVSVHFSEVLCRARGVGPAQLVGGPLLKVSAWAAAHRVA